MTQNEYATLIYYWAGHPQPERIPEALESLERAEWASSAELDLAIAGIVMAFESAYPDRKHAWRAAYPILRRRVKAAAGASADCPEWADYHVSQWLILRRESSLDAILDMIADGDECGRAVQLKIQGKTVQQSVPLRKALEKAREARKLAMLIQ
jgi:hypothetical protein